MKPSKLFKNLTLLIVSVSALCGCGNGSAKSDDEPVYNPQSLYEGISLMATTKNYTIHQLVDGDVYKSYVVSRCAIGVSGVKELEDTNFYVVSGKGLFKVTYDEEYRRSEYILDEDGNYITDLWNTNYVKTTYGVNPDEVITDKSATSINIKNRDFKQGLLGILGLKSTSYADIEYVKASFDGTLNFELKYFSSDTIYTYEADKFGTSSIDYAKTLIEHNVGAFVPNDDLKYMRSLIKGNNFKLDSYDVIEEGYYAQEWLNPQYWYSSYGNYGYCRLDHAADKTVDGDVDAKGIYMFQVSDGKLGFYSNPIDDAPTIAEFENYPSRMSTLSNMQYINEGEYEDIQDYEYQGEAYYLTNKTYVLDVLSHFALNPSTATDGSIFQLATPKAIVMDINIDPLYDENDEASEKSTITYIYVFEYSNKTYQMYLPMHSFGLANITSLDAYLETFNNAK